MPDNNYPVESIGSETLITVPFSFETNEVGTYKLPTLPYRCKLKEVKTVLYKAAAATDAGTVTIKTGSTALATVTVAASSAIGAEDEAPTVTETAFDTDDQISITTAKSTAGGKGVLFLIIEILPSH